jgi:hypothetical protein
MPEPVAYALRFRGEAVPVDGRRLWSESRAPGSPFVRALGDAADASADGPAVPAGVEAVCRRELRLDEDGTFVCAGEIAFSPVDAVTFHASGALAESPAAGLRHGTAVCAVTGGRGRLAAASGSIASQLLLSADGTLVDHQLGLLFVEQPSAKEE